MFGLGLEFSLRKLLQVGPTAGLIAVAETSAMVWFGYLAGQALGWTPIESIYAGAIIAISSTTIIVKAFAEHGIKGKIADIVFGVLIMEDLIAILLLAILTTISAGADLSTGSLAVTAGKLAIFLAGLVGVGLLIIPRLVRFIVGLNRPETTLVASVGICFAAALLASAFGYSVALGAFIAGSLVAESGEERIIELVAPVRDIFVAIFFVAVGMLINPTLIAERWVEVVVFGLIVITGKVLAISVSAFFTGYSVRTSVQTGMSLAQIGEFSFIIAAVGLQTGATRDFLYPVAITVSAITTLTTPWLIRASGRAASHVDRHLPGPLQTFVALYGTWLQSLRSAPNHGGGRYRPRRLIRLLLLDALVLAGLIIGVSLEAGRVSAMLSRVSGISDEVARYVVIAGAIVVAVPLIVGMTRIARFLGLTLALRALPAAPEGKIDLALAPRRVLVVTIQLGIVLLVGIPLLAVTQPFVPPLRSAGVLIVVLGLLGVGFWRSAMNLQGHARAGAELIVAALAQQMAKPANPADASGDGTNGLERVHQLLPGLGEPKVVRLGAESHAVDRTLAQLDLRGLTGAAVLAITRSGEPVIVPTGREVLRAGDMLALAGTDDAVAAATKLLE